MSIASCGLDTNILTRWIVSSDPQHTKVVHAITALKSDNTELFIAFQTIAEFWNVLTRPVAQNGCGYSVVFADTELKRIENLFPILYESAASYALWRRLIVEKGVSGVQVHDARLASVYLSSGIHHLLTLNARDFVRYGMTVVDPAQVMPPQEKVAL